MGGLAAIFLSCQQLPLAKTVDLVAKVSDVGHGEVFDPKRSIGRRGKRGRGGGDTE